MPIHELAALGAALCWATTGIMVAEPLRVLGTRRFNRWRGWIAAGGLLLIVVAGQRWTGFRSDWLLPMALSGLVGIALGDTVNYAAVRRLGPRRAGALFALNAPMAALLGWAFLGEALRWNAVLGVSLTVAGVAIAVLGRRPAASRAHLLEQTTGALWVGAACGLGAALGQASASLVARPVMAAGADPYLASLIRVGVSTMALTAMLPLVSEGPVPDPVPRRTLVLSVATAILGLLVGMTLIMFALQGGKVGIVATLSATSPVLILPLLWWRTGQRPTAASWLGAAVAVAGIGAIFLR